MMTMPQIEAALAQRQCAIVEDGGRFALVYPYGYEGRKRAHDLEAKRRSAAIIEAWDWLHPENRVAEQIDTIQRVIARDYGTTAETLIEKGRTEPLATARRIAMVLSRRLTPATLAAVGAAFGGRDHGTVIHAERSIDAETSVDEQLFARVATLSSACTAEFARSAKKVA